MKRIKRWGKQLSILFLALILAIAGINWYVLRVGQALVTDQPQKADAIIVPGASVYGTQVSPALAQRLDTAYRLYQDGYAENIIVSGDHGTKDYNEVNAMKTYLVKKGIPQKHIFMDHAGFSTYDTVYRAKDIFQVEQALIVTQTEHLYRALYVANALGLSAVGISAGDYGDSLKQTQRIREVFARVKAFLQCEILHPEPEFLGDPIPVSEFDGSVTEG
ncbi:MAG: YdcF family protein [Clostridia bacterium]|nr:YdcF family protein [Clostridia bacterium]